MKQSCDYHIRLCTNEHLIIITLVIKLHLIYICLSIAFIGNNKVVSKMFQRYLVIFSINQIS